MFLSLAFILLPILAAYLIVSTFWPRERQAGALTSLKLSLSLGTGLGLMSVLYFIQLLVAGPSMKAQYATLATLLAVFGAAFIYRRRSYGRGGEAEAADSAHGGAYNEDGSKLKSIFKIIFVLALLFAIASIVFATLRAPHGEWDAWAVYNMKARFIFRAGEDWRALFSRELYWTGTDYPLLIPMTVAAIWSLIGRETLAGPALVAAIFTLGSAGLLTGSVYILKGKSQGWLAGVVLLCTPYYILHGANQYSDIPIGFFFLATITLFAFYDGLRERGAGLLFLAGLMAGLAAWTKNEGLLFILVIAVARLAVVFRMEGLKPYLRQMLYFGGGVLPSLLVVVYLKMVFAMPNGLLAPPEGQNLIGKLLDFSRYRIVVNQFVRMSLAFGDWSVSIVPLLIFYLLLVGSKVEERQRGGAITAGTALGLMVVGYFAIFLISPRDLEWHMATSLNRLLSQLWPSALFFAFMIARAPEEALVKEEANLAERKEPALS